MRAFSIRRLDWRLTWPIALAVLAWTAWWIAYDPHRFKFLAAWHFSVAGARRMFGYAYPGYPLAGGIHLYASYPKLQSGPLTFITALPVALLPQRASDAVGVVVMYAAGPAIVWLVADAARRTGYLTLRRAKVQGLLFWALLAPLWGQLAITFGHYDDVLALVLVAAAINAMSRSRATTAAVLLGASAGAKPWAIAFLPLALVCADGKRMRHLLEAVGVMTVVWLPFLVTDWHTLRAATFKIAISPNSVMALFHPIGKTPSWVRPVQFVGGAALALLCVARRRWPAVVMVAIALRIGVDPHVYSYYTTGMLVGTGIWDLLGSRWKFPVATAIGFVAIYWTTFWSLPLHVMGVIRLCYVLSVPLLSIVGSRRTHSGDDEPDRPLDRFGGLFARQTPLGDEPLVGGRTPQHV